MITQFQGESRHDAIINHFGLDIEEEADFLRYITEQGYSIDTDDVILSSLHLSWNNLSFNLQSNQQPT